jgi:acyl dehydratase
VGEPKRTDMLVAGEELAPFTFQVTEEFNENFLHSMEDFHPRYMEGHSAAAPIIHAGLLFNFSNLTRSPSFSLPAGVAAIHTHEEATFLQPAPVGSTLTVSWKIIDTYEKRGRLYQVVEALITTETGSQVLRRVSTNIYMGEG